MTLFCVLLSLFFMNKLLQKIVFNGCDSSEKNSHLLEVEVKQNKAQKFSITFSNTFNSIEFR